MNPRLILFVLAGRPGGVGATVVGESGMNYTTFFTRFGKGYYLFLLVNEFRGAAGTDYIATDLPTRWKSYVQQFDGEQPNIRATISDASDQLANWIDSLSGPPSWIASSLQSLVAEMTNDVHRLANKQPRTAIAELIREMLADGKFVNANTISISATAHGGNAGNGALVLSLLDGSGKQLEYVYDEALDLTFSGSGPATAGTERATVTGTASADGYFSQNWPLGSGTNTSFNSSAADGSSNLLSNGDFETFTTPNVPDDWTIDVGVAGAQVLSESSTIYKGAKSLRIVGNGSNLTTLSQELTSLKSKTPYAVNLWVAMSATPSTGVLQVELWDGSAVIEDESGNPNSLAIDLTTLGTSFADQGAAFRLPEPLPGDSVSLRLRLTTALENAKTLYIDEFSLVPMIQLYNAGGLGPFVALFSGSENWSDDDLIVINVSNDYDGGIQTGFWRSFDMPKLGLILPSKDDGSENIGDAYIA